MTLIEVENLSLADLKARRDELVAALAKVNAADLANRYVQARTDARLRDERLAEQGATLLALQEGVRALTAERDRAVEAWKTARAAVGALEAETAAQIEHLKAAVAQLTEERLATEQAHIEELVKVRKANAHLTDALKESQALAKRRRAVLADLSGRIAPLLVEES